MGQRYSSRATCRDGYVQLRPPRLARLLHWLTIARSQATALIGTGEGAKVKEGVELLLTNDVPESGPGVSDAGALLQRGLGLLASSPYEALGIPVGCGTIDVRKAYKKMALKYHPGPIDAFLLTNSLTVCY